MTDDATTLTQLPALRLIGIEITGDREGLGQRVPQAWRDIVARLDRIGPTTEDGILYAAFTPMPTAGREDGPPAYAYFIGAPVATGAEAPEGMRVLEVPARRYAKTRVQGDASAIEQAYVRVYEWIERAPHDADPDARAIERYDRKRQDVLPPYSRFDYDVLVPLRS